MNHRAPDVAAPDAAGRAAFAAVLLVGIGLRTWQWLGGTPLWIDELALTNGVLAGPFSGLFDGPADFAQVAPPGFLALAWVLYQLAPESELLLRAPAFVASCAAIPATWFAARELVGERHAWLAPALVAIAGRLIFMGSQVKPYAADAFFAAALVAAVLRYERLSTRRSLLVLLVTGALAPLFSFGSVFVIAGVGFYLLFPRPWRMSAFAARIPVFAVWAVSGAFALWLSNRLLNPAADALMADYWQMFFPPFPPESLRDVLWPISRILDFLWGVIGFRGVRLWGILLLVGLLLAWRRRPPLAGLFVVPVLAALVAAAVEAFPFGQRLTHWIVPMAGLLLTVVTAWIAGFIRVRQPVMHALPALAVLATPALTLLQAPPVYVRDDIRPVLARLEADAQPTDAMWVYWGAWHTWQRHFRATANTLGTVVHAVCPRDYPRGHFRSLDQLRGQPRAWILFSRLEPETLLGSMREYLDAIGVRQDSLVVGEPGEDLTTKVILWRYDLSDSARFSGISADSFPVPAGLESRRDACSRIDAMFVRGDGTRVVPLE